MPHPSFPPETSIGDSTYVELTKEVRRLEDILADMKKFETLLLSVNRCFIEAVFSKNPSLLKNAHDLQIIIDGACGIRDDFEKGLLKSPSDKKKARNFLDEKSKEIALMISFQKEMSPLIKLIAMLQNLLSENTFS